MRMKRLGMQSVLHYDAFDLDFGEEQNGLHVLYGPNETGKSTLLHVLLDVLFGGRIEGDRKELYPSPKSRITGVIERVNGTELRVNRKKNRSTLVLAEGSSTELSEDQLITLVGGYDRERFTLLFGFDHARLRQGGESLLQSGGHAGVSLFEAGGGVQHLQRLFTTLTERSTQLLDPGFTKTSAKQLNKALRAYKEAEKAIRTCGMMGDEWHGERRHISDVEHKITELTAQKTQYSRILSKLQRVLRVRGSIGRWQTFKDLLEKMGRVVVLSADEDERIIQILIDYENAVKARNELTSALQQYESDIESIHVNRRVLAHEELIGLLSEQLTQYIDFKQLDIPRLMEQKLHHEKAAEELLSSLAPELNLQEVEKLRIPFVLGERIQQISVQVKDAHNALTVAKQRVEEQVTVNARIEGELVGLRESIDVSALRLLITQVRQEGNLEKALYEKEQEWAASRVALEGLLRTQNFWNGSAEELATLPIPLRETIDQFEHEWRTVTHEIEAAEREFARLKAEFDKVQVDIDMFEKNGHVPDESELGEIRRRRDLKWELVQRVWLKEEMDEEILREYGSYESLAQSYSSSIQHADQMGDWMRRESKRLAHRMELIRQKTQRTHDIQVCEDGLTAKRQQFIALSERFTAAWEKTGITPLSPIEMRAWMTEYYRPIRAELQQVQELARDRDTIRERGDKYIFQAQSELLRLQMAKEPQIGDLNRWIQRCEQVASEAEERERIRRDLINRLKESNEQFERYDRIYKQALAEYEEVTRAWMQIQVQHPSLPNDADIAIRYVGQIHLLFDHVGHIQNIQDDIAGKQNKCHDFESQGDQLATLLEEDLSPHVSCEHWVRGLLKRLNESKEQDVRIGEMEKRITEIETNIKQLEGEMDELESILAVSKDQYGCADQAALRELIRKSREYKRIDQQKKETEIAVRESGDGLIVETLEMEVEEMGDPDAIQSQIYEIEQKINQLAQQVDSEQQQLWSLKQKFEAWDGSQADAAEQAQNAQNYLAEVDQYWNQYLRIELARRLLKRAIDQFRQQNESSILELAGAFFAKLTLGHYPELTVQYSDNEPYLAAKNSDGYVIRIHQMSDGTRDQLFLAMRLAFIEQHLRSAEPLPLIMDDILVHFDDDRAQATLEVLRQLAQKTQVIYFTHQRSVVSAVERMRDNLIHYHDLSERRSTAESTA